jgi:hypothetical protein
VIDELGTRVWVEMWDENAAGKNIRLDNVKAKIRKAVPEEAHNRCLHG